MVSARYARRRTPKAVLHDSWGFAGHRMFRWLFRAHGLKFYIILMCPLIAAGVWGARQADFLITRMQSGLVYCADDPIVEFDRCDSLPEGQIACKQRAVERLRRYQPICWPDSVAALN